MKSVSDAAASGFVWSSLSQVVKVGSQLSGLVVLARILPASDFGLIAMASIVTGFALLFRDLGTAAAIIQRADLGSELLDSVFWFNVLVGLGLAIALVLLSPAVAWFFSEPRLREVLCWLALTYPLASLGLVHQALLERASNFKPVAIVESLAALIGLISAIWAAVLGWGVYSLVVQTLISAVVAATGFWMLSTWRPGRSGSMVEMKKVWGFSANLVGFNIINYFNRNVDNILIGRLLGATELGFYSMAYRLMLWPLQNISSVVGRALFPVFSRIQYDASRVSSAYLRASAAIMLISAPLMLGIFVLREPLIGAMLGDAWMPVADLLFWLAPIGLLQSIGTTVGVLYLAMGRTDLMLRWGVFSGVIIALSFMIGIQWGLRGLVIGYLLVTLILFLPSLMIPLQLIGLKVNRLLIALLPLFVVAVIMAFVVGGTNQMWLGTNISPELRLGSLIGLGVFSYGVLVCLFQRSLLLGIFRAFVSRS